MAVWEGHSLGEREKMKTPPEIIEPIKKLVEAAWHMLNVSGITQTDGRRHVCVKANERAYHIRMEADQFDAVRLDKRSADIRVGLFISAVDLNGRRQEKMIQTPAKPEGVDLQSAYILRAIFPESFLQASEDIRSGARFPFAKWNETIRATSLVSR